MCTRTNNSAIFACVGRSRWVSVVSIGTAFRRRVTIRPWAPRPTKTDLSSASSTAGDITDTGFSLAASWTMPLGNACERRAYTGPTLKRQNTHRRTRPHNYVRDIIALVVDRPTGKTAWRAHDKYTYLDGTCRWGTGSWDSRLWTETGKCCKRRRWLANAIPRFQPPLRTNGLRHDTTMRSFRSACNVSRCATQQKHDGSEHASSRRATDTGLENEINVEQATQRPEFIRARDNCTLSLKRERIHTERSGRVLHSLTFRFDPRLSRLCGLVSPLADKHRIIPRNTDDDHEQLLKYSTL